MNELLILLGTLRAARQRSALANAAASVARAELRAAEEAEKAALLAIVQRVTELTGPRPE